MEETNSPQTSPSQPVAASGQGQEDPARQESGAWHAWRQDTDFTWTVGKPDSAFNQSQLAPPAGVPVAGAPATAGSGATQAYQTPAQGQAPMGGGAVQQASVGQENAAAGFSQQATAQPGVSPVASAPTGAAATGAAPTGTAPTATSPAGGAQTGQAAAGQAPAGPVQTAQTGPAAAPRGLTVRDIFSTVLSRDDLPERYRPLSAWAYLGYILLFCVPVIGLVFAIYFAVAAKNDNLKNLARAMLLILLIYVVLWIVILIIALAASGGSIENIVNPSSNPTLTA